MRGACRGPALLGLLLAATLAWTGCGFGSQDPHQAYNDCLRQQGSAANAVETCAPKLPQNDPIRRRAATTRLNRYIACMRQHGVNLPSPGSQGGAVGLTLPSGVDTNSQEYKAAAQACKAFDPLAAPL